MTRSFRLTWPGAGALALLLAACGGGGSDAGVQPPAVTLASTTSVKYSETMLVTLSGVRLDQALTLTSTGCRDFVRSTTAPNVSTASTAYYTCTVSGAGNRTVEVSGAGVALASVPFTVPVPQVSMVVGNGAGVAGTLVFTLAPDAAPRTVDNFLAYVKSGFYNGLAFHRHARFDNGSTFVLQGGGHTAPVSSAAAFPPEKPASAAIPLEVGRGLSNLRYTLAMARLNTPDSATSQFFINTVNNAAILDPSVNSAGYAVFGSVTGNTALVDLMVAAPCNLSPVNFDLDPRLLPSQDCVPEPNLIISGALQTR
ncbi:MAG: peptidylprolyl isomerase [Rubrivivax sp.]|nr:peptidylprolyl isomerase [Rubrivivax sp.]